VDPRSVNSCEKSIEERYLIRKKGGGPESVANKSSETINKKVVEGMLTRGGDARKEALLWEGA